MYLLYRKAVLNDDLGPVHFAICVQLAATMPDVTWAEVVDYVSAPPTPSSRPALEPTREGLVALHRAGPLDPADGVARSRARAGAQGHVANWTQRLVRRAGGSVPSGVRPQSADLQHLASRNGLRENIPKRAHCRDLRLRPVRCGAGHAILRRPSTAPVLERPRKYLWHHQRLLAGGNYDRQLDRCRVHRQLRFLHDIADSANIRSLTMTLVFDKALCLSSASRQEYTAGEVLTLMSVDAERVFTAMLQSPWHVMGPLAFVVSIMMIGLLLDAYSALAGAVVLVVVMWITVKQGDLIAHLQRRLLEVIEKRVKVTSEALQGIRVMKYYAWEEPLAQRVEKLRAREVTFLRKFHSFQVVNTVMLFLTPTFLSGVTLGLYVLLHSTIDVIEAFTLIAMVNICRTALFQLPQAISSFCKAKISLSRIDAFLASDEVVMNGPLLSNTAESEEEEDEGNAKLQPLISSDYTEDAGLIARGDISIRDAGFSWPVANQNDLVVVLPAIEAQAPSPQSKAKDAGRETSFSRHNSIDPGGFRLNDMNLRIARGSLVMIVGKCLKSVGE
ncbi:hypothetical protein ON010_g17301 [Phytophthora cinnamomi]|nr:hypothetical protein ON010_g17301 [Phytophthora cinnamomi]